jgi:hypothetical protein
MFGGNQSRHSFSCSYVRQKNGQHKYDGRVIYHAFIHTHVISWLVFPHVLHNPTNLDTDCHVECPDRKINSYANTVITPTCICSNILIRQIDDGDDYSVAEPLKKSKAYVKHTDKQWNYLSFPFQHAFTFSSHNFQQNGISKCLVLSLKNQPQWVRKHRAIPCTFVVI